MSAMSAHKLTYFNIAGAAEKVRLAFHLNGIAFEDERINFEQWKDIKPTTKFGQVPMLVLPDGMEMAQSLAMMMYVARLNPSSGSYPADPVAAMRVDEMIGLAQDFDKSVLPSLYLNMMPAMFGFPADWPKTPEGQAQVKAVREDFVANKLPERVAHYVRALETTGSFLCGDTPTIADCYVFAQLKSITKGVMDHIPTTCLDEYPAIQAWMARFAAIPAIESYLAPK